nr:PREDICTED: ammonium transporter Rh type B-like [Paralichthys olivaceus]
MTDAATNMRLKLPITCFILEIILIILFGTLVQYDYETDAAEWHNKTGHSDYENDFYYRYASECPVDVWRLRVRGHSDDRGAEMISLTFEPESDKNTIYKSWKEVLGRGTSGTPYLDRYLFDPSLDKQKTMDGTLYLWMFWPSFNSAVTAHGDDQHRTAMNTYYSLAACTLSSYAMSALTAHDGKLDMVHIQNAALAGGVAAGTAGEMMLTPFGSMIVGFLAGIISVLGYKYLTPILEDKLKIQDTCGVNNLHGMPGILGAIVGAVTAAVATVDVYGAGMADVFPDVASGEIDASAQGVRQAIALAVTLGIALLGGLIVGFILKLPVFGAPPDTICFEDSIYWEVPGEEEKTHEELVVVKMEETEKLNI